MATTEYIKTVNYTAPRSTVLSTLEYALNGVQTLVAASPWDSLRTFAKSTILSILKRVHRGQLRIESVGEVHEFGSPFCLDVDGYQKDLTATIAVLDERFWVRLFLYTDFGFADAYMLNEIEVDSLDSVFRLFILNRKALSEMDTFVSPIIRTLSWIANHRLANRLETNVSNISAHYDLSNEVFQAFLSYDMTYSCAVFDAEAKGPTGDLIEDRSIAPPRLDFTSAPFSKSPDDLERGQLQKLHLVAQRARICPGQRVLEIGCGWGSFAILAAGTYGATVDAITISVEQKCAIDKNVHSAGLSHKITVHVLDYRDMPSSFKGAFDAVVSIGVMEHVGIEFMKVWFKKMSWAMKPEGSFKVFTMSTVPDTRWSMYASEVDFVRKYIYPGGQLSSVKTLVEAITSAGLNVDSIENIGPHYARTLREWSRRFTRNFSTHIKPALCERYPDLTEKEVDIFERKWKYYFAYSEAGFSMRSISDHLFVTTREANLNIEDAAMAVVG